MGESEEVVDVPLTKNNAGFSYILYRGINRIHGYCKLFDIKNLECNLYWGHYKSSTPYPEHFEDEETSIDMFNYIADRVVSDTKVKYNHIIEKKPDDFKYSVPFIGTNENPEFFKKFVDVYNPNKTKKNKICFWGLNKNLLSNRTFRRLRYGDRWDPHSNWLHQTHDDWLLIKSFLEKHYEVVELSYRLPIREVYYHISTCEFTIGYFGAFHVLSSLLNKPNISISGLNNRLHPKTMSEFEAYTNKNTVWWEQMTLAETGWYNPTTKDVCNIDNINYYKKLAFDKLKNANE